MLLVRGRGAEGQRGRSSEIWSRTGMRRRMNFLDGTTQHNRPKTELNPYCIIITIIIMSHILGNFSCSYLSLIISHSRIIPILSHFTTPPLSYLILSFPSNTPYQVSPASDPLHLMIPILSHPPPRPPPIIAFIFHLPSSTHSCPSSWLLNHFEIGISFQMTPVSCVRCT